MLRKATLAYTKLQKRKKEESERITGERDKIKLIDLRFEKMVSCRIQESKTKTRRSINCMFLGSWRIFGIELVD